MYLIPFNWQLTTLTFMQKIPFFKKFVTCVLAGLVIGEAIFRQGVTYFRDWLPSQALAAIPFVATTTAVIYVVIWQQLTENDLNSIP